MKYIALFLALLSFPVAAQNAAPPIDARLIAPTATVDGTSAPLALEIKLPQGWHTYWRTPGIAGLPPSLTWTTKENVSNVELQYPVPMRMTEQGLQSFVYNNSVTFPLVATLVTAGQQATLNGKVDIVMCADICVPASASIAITIPTDAGSVDQAAWQTAQSQMPHTDGATVTAITRINDTLQIDVQHSPDQQFTDVFVENDDAILLKAATVLPIEGGSRFTAPFDTANEAPQLDNKPVTLTLVGMPASIELKGTVGQTAPSPQPSPQGEGVSSAQDDSSGEIVKHSSTPSPWGEGWGEGVFKIILIALLGGLILNLMPCVLPVLSLKLLTIISHAGHDSAATVRRGFMATALGIMVSFWLLAAGTIALMQTGMALGWGLQFQHPAFTAIIVVVLLLFAANLFGLFEFRLPWAVQRHLGKPSAETSVAKEFFTGMAATALATPCSAPFVGTAISFALAQSAGVIVTIFTALGLGLSAPYLLVAIFPRAVQYMPHPGKWMLHLRTVMGVLLLASAAWFGTVLYTQVTQTKMVDDTMEWSAFAPETIPAIVASGKTVFLDITADWCLTCHANKAFVLNAEPTRGLLHDMNVVLMKADWTKPDDAIQAYLKTYNRYGIPFNVVFGPHAPQGILLPELLTMDAVKDALEKAK